MWKGWKRTAENFKLQSTREKECWKTKRPFGLIVHQDGEASSIHSALVATR
jgi:hypothetical protein